MWSPHASHYVTHMLHDIALTPETRILRNYISAELKQLSKRGRAGYGAPGKFTETEGTSAGCMTLVKKYWFSKLLTSSTDSQGKINTDSRLSGRSVRIKGVDIIVLTGYFLSGGSPSDPINRRMLQDVDNLTRGGKNLFILGADFNFGSEKLKNDITPWLRILRAVVVEPTDSNYTCKGAEGARDTLIDYFLVSASLRPLVQSCHVVLDTPWGPHLGVILNLSTELDKVMAWQMSKPKKHSKSKNRR